MESDLSTLRNKDEKKNLRKVFLSGEDENIMKEERSRMNLTSNQNQSHSFILRICCLADRTNNQQTNIHRKLIFCLFFIAILIILVLFILLIQLTELKKIL
jgi:hypothetical protein